MTENEVKQKLVLDLEDEDLRKGSWWDGRYFKRKNGRIHRLVAQRVYGSIAPGLVVDHINRDRKDNRRANLRLVDQSENIRNTDGKTAIRKSRFRGVFPTRNGKWSAQITIRGERRTLGTFDREEAAALAYQEAQSLYCGLAGTP